MGSIGAGFSMSLDGYIAGVNDAMERLFAWMFAGNTDVTVTIGEKDLDLKMGEGSAEMYQEAAQGIGAIISGRRMFDVAAAWGGKHPLNVPIVVVTHHPPQEWLDKPDSPFTFVTDGIASAVATAQTIAGDKGIGVGGANVAQQCLKLGLLDEIHVDLVPVLLGDGIRLFDHLDAPIELENTQVLSGTGVTHLTFHVIKSSTR